MNSASDIDRFISELFEAEGGPSLFQDKFNAICKQNWQIPAIYLAGLEVDAVPFTIKPEPYLKIREYLGPQSYKSAQTSRKQNRLAYKAYLLFETREGLKAYVDRCRRDSGDNTLSGSEWMRILAPKFPKPERWREVAFREWGTAFVQHGYKRILNHFSVLDRPLYDRGGNISFRRMNFAAVALPWKDRVPENTLEPLTDLALRFKKKPSEFKRVLEYSFLNADKVPPGPKIRLPDFTIDGEKFGMPGAIFRKMDRRDPRLLYLGHFTNCCEKVYDGENTLERAVEQACKTDYNGYDIVERDGDILAHSWAWRGKQAEMVFDGFESFEKKFNIQKLKNLLDAIEQEITDDRYDLFKLNGLYLGRCAEHLAINGYPVSIPVEAIMPDKIKGIGLTQKRFNVISPPTCIYLTFNPRTDISIVTHKLEPG